MIEHIMLIKSWHKGDKLKCPNCNTALPEPYECQLCNIKLKLKC